MTARTIKKIQVPAYWPSEVGVQSSEKRGVLNEVKKVMIISDMVMVMEESDMPDVPDMPDMPDMESVAVDEAMDIVMDMDPVDVAVAIDIDVVISLMSIFAGGGNECWLSVKGSPIRSAEDSDQSNLDTPSLGTTPNIYRSKRALIATREQRPSHGAFYFKAMETPRKGSDNQDRFTFRVWVFYSRTPHAIAGKRFARA
jgi:hypothetical protein